MGYKLVLVTDHPSAWQDDGWIETNEYIMVADTEATIEYILSPTFLKMLLDHANRNWDNTIKFVKTEGGDTNHTGSDSNGPNTALGSDFEGILDHEDCLGPTIRENDFD